MLAAMQHIQQGFVDFRLRFAATLQSASADFKII